MNDDALEPLPDELLRLLSEERDGYPEDAALKHEVLQGVEQALLSALPLAPAPAAQPTLRPAANLTVRTAALSAFVGGALVGSAITYGVLSHRETRALPVPQVPAVAAPARAPASEAPRPVVEPLAPSTASTPAPHSTRPAKTRASASSDLLGEQQALSVARAALVRGRFADALAATESHARLYPHGQLEEEREILAIQALLLSHERALAERRAARFRQRFPNSVLSAALEAAMEGAVPSEKALDL
jgi:hypothetical protein